MNLVKLKIKRIEKTKNIGKVFDLSVEQNNNFFIGKTQILTHNCDYFSLQGQAALRNVMETFSKSTRFILTCNYVDKIIEPVQSRCQVFNVSPPTKKEIAIHLSNILNKESVDFSKEDLAVIINSNYPDIRRILNTAQRCVIGGKLTLDADTMVEHNYHKSITDVLSSKKDRKTKFTEIRQILADNYVRDYTALYRFLYDNVEEYASGNISTVILIIAEAQYKDALVVDHEINAMAMFIQILTEIDNKKVL